MEQRLSGDPAGGPPFPPSFIIGMVAGAGSAGVSGPGEGSALLGGAIEHEG